MKKHLLMKTLLVALVCLVGGTSSVWGETITKTVYSWTFTGNAGDETVTLNEGTTLTENSTSCKLATAPANCAGLYFQTSGTDTNGWKCYKNTTGLRNLCGGNRMCIVPGLSAGDVITISCNNTDYITASKSAGTANGGKTLMTYTMSADGNFWFQFQKTKDPDYPSLYSIKVTREIKAVIVKSWDLTNCTWAKASGFGTSTVTINASSCTYATGALEGLALQGGSGTSWQVNSSGLRQDNGTRNIAILDLKAGDAVTVVSNTSAISSLVNGTSVNDTYTGTCKFSVTNDGTFGFSVERYTSASTNAYTSSIVVYRALSEVAAEYNEVKDIAEALRDVPNDNSAANSTLSSAITTQNAAVASATTSAEISAAKTALLNAVMTYIATANPTTGNQFDLTFLLTNPDVEGVTDWGDAAAQGWFTDIPTTGLGDYNNFAARTNLNSSKNGIERYTSNVYTTANTFALYQKVTLPAGNYSFDAYALANNASNIVVAAGNAEGDAVTSSDFTAYSVDFTQASNSEIKIGIKIAAEGTNAANWMAITGLKLYKEPASTVSVTVTSAGFATYVPSYDLDFSTTEIEAYKVKVTSKGVATLTKVNNVPAGTPVLLYKAGGDTEDIPVMTGAAAVTENDLVAGTGATVATTVGDYTNMILNNVSGNVGFYFANDKIVAANRAYLHFATTLAPAAAARMTMIFEDDDVTGVNEVRSQKEDVRSEWFDLQGRKVAQPAKGLYIVNGRKVVVK